MLVQILFDYHTPMKQKRKKYLKCNKNKIKMVTFKLVINQKFKPMS